MTLIAPIRMRDKQAAQFLGVSVSWIRQQRLEDKAALAQGKPPSGPPWRREGAGVWYYRLELEAWADDRRMGSELYGQKMPNNAENVLRYNERRQTRQR